MADIVPVRRVLVSVSDKAGVPEFAAALHGQGAEIISTGGTAVALRAAGLPVTPIEAVTGFPEMMDGRLKTLHPMVHGGLLAVRDDPAHAAAMRQHGIRPIDLVCINLYPFARTVARPGVTRAEAIENIDIGGPSMVRSAAKNHAFVAVATDPAQYPRLLAEIRDHGGTTPATRRELAQAAFELTARYDAAIAGYLAGEAAGTELFPESIALRFTRHQTLRYGENPHQLAAVYRDDRFAGPGVLTARQLHGKELSYNNVADAAAALELALALSAPGAVAAAVIKHANPCGAAVASGSANAADRALAGDPLAAFGGIMALSGPVDAPTAERLVRKDVFLEVLIAPAFEPAALETLRARSANIRLLELPAGAARLGPAPAQATAPLMHRSIPGGLLVQQQDVTPPAPQAWRLAAGPAPGAEVLRAAGLLETMVRAMASNAVAVGGLDPADGVTVRLHGAGLGQVDRLTASRTAAEKARGAIAAARAKGLAVVAVSDAFFPFPDGPEALLDAGATVLVHPGGSKRDQETFDLCAARGASCLLTGVRRFRH